MNGWIVSMSAEPSGSLCRRPVHEPRHAEPAEESKVRDAVVTRLSHMIHSDLLLPGDLLPGERCLAQAFGVARETLRSAIGVLQQRCMVSVNQGSRSKVIGTGQLHVVDPAIALKQLARMSLAHVFEAREAVETLLIQLAVPNVHDGLSQRLERLIDLQIKWQADPAAFLIFDIEFHRTIYDASGNTVFAAMAIDFYLHEIQRTRQALSHPGAIGRRIQEHRDIASALHSRNLAHAIAIIGSHVRSAAAEILRELSTSAPASRPGLRPRQSC